MLIYILALYIAICIVHIVGYAKIVKRQKNLQVRIKDINESELSMHVVKANPIPFMLAGCFIDLLPFIPVICYIKGFRVLFFVLLIINSIITVIYTFALAATLPIRDYLRNLILTGILVIIVTIFLLDQSILLGIALYNIILTAHLSYVTFRDSLFRESK